MRHSCASQISDQLDQHDQQPRWPNEYALARVRDRLAMLPALVTEQECAAVAAHLQAASRGSALVIQGGDCAERFADATAGTVRAKVDQLDGLAGILGTAVAVPVARIGRIAGQYAKPRSAAWEQLPSGEVIPSYRGDAVNQEPATAEARRCDPARLLRAYDCAAATLTHLRSSWLGRFPHERVHASHEALLLDYEWPLLRRGTTGAGALASSGHLLWIGDRTRSAGGAHVRFASAISNPVGVKIGPAAAPPEVVQLTRLLNREGAEGRLTLIVRLGARQTEELLPPLVRAVARAGAPVLWLCDPMHGNTVRTSYGQKTRPLDLIHAEIRSFARILFRYGQWPGGLHLETAAEPVTECVSTAAELPAVGWLPRYRSACDPRLNPEQAAEVVAGFARELVRGYLGK